jgi:hypothetical protein
MGEVRFGHIGEGRWDIGFDSGRCGRVSKVEPGGDCQDRREECWIALNRGEWVGLGDVDNGQKGMAVTYETRAQMSAGWSLIECYRWRAGRRITDNVYKVLAVARSTTLEVIGPSRTSHNGMREGCTGCVSRRGVLRFDASRFSQTDGLPESATLAFTPEDGAARLT